MSKALEIKKDLSKKKLSSRPLDNSAQISLDKKALSKAVLAAAERAGEQFGEDGLVSYLEAQALATPSPFLTLLAKAIYETEENEQKAVHKIEIVSPLDLPLP